jgi:hypothetical protein
MGRHIKSLMDAAAAAGYAMAAEDIYAFDDRPAEELVAMQPRSTALVPFEVAAPSVSLVAQARALAARYAYPAWLMPRLPA